MNYGILEPINHAPAPAKGVHLQLCKILDSDDYEEDVADCGRYRERVGN